MEMKKLLLIILTLSILSCKKEPLPTPEPQQQDTSRVVKDYNFYITSNKKVLLYINGVNEFPVKSEYNLQSGDSIRLHAESYGSRLDIDVYLNHIRVDNAHCENCKLDYIKLLD